jgi:hypothetical protein
MEKFKACIVKHEIEEPTTLITNRELALIVEDRVDVPSVCTIVKTME